MLFATLLGIYLLAGLVFSAVFFLVGYRIILPDATGSKFRVRLVWVPGAIAIWPLLGIKWLRASQEAPA